MWAKPVRVENKGAYQRGYRAFIHVLPGAHGGGGFVQDSGNKDGDDGMATQIAALFSATRSNNVPGFFRGF